MTFPRRSFLKGLTLSAGGAVYLSPLLRQAAHAADGKVRTAPRFLFVLEGNGLPPQQVHPAGLPFVPRADRENFQEFRIVGDTFPTALKPVAGYADRMLVVQGLNGEVCGGGHSTSHGALGAYNTRDGKVIHGPTVDCVLGRRAGAVFDNVVLGVSQQQDRGVVFNCSAYGVNQSAATFCDPAAARDRLFGAAAGGSASARQSVLLDYLADDIRRARGELAGGERQKFDAYLSAYEGIRVRDERAAATSAQRPAGDRKGLPPADDPEGRLDFHFDLGTRALVAGLTDVVTIASGVGFRHFNIQFSKLASMPKHGIGHGVIAGQADAVAQAEAIRAYHFGLIAKAMKRLDAVPEGNGTMLDNTVIVYLSDAADTHHTHCYEWPMVLLGGAKRLKLDGRYLVYPRRGEPGWRTVNAVHNTLLHAAGVEENAFGHFIKDAGDSAQKGPLTEVFA